LKILFPIENIFPSQLGGTGNTLYWHSCFLKRNGFSPIIIATNAGIIDIHDIELNKWIDTDCGKIIYCSGGSNSFKVFRNGLKVMEDVEIVHFSSLFYPYSIILSLIAIIKRKKIILSPRGELFSSALNNKKVKKNIALLYYRLIQKKILFHATSEHEIKTIKNIFNKSKIVYQKNFFSTKYYEKNDNFKKNLVFLGRINPIKNIESLISAISRSKNFIKKGDKLLIAGISRKKEEKSYYEELLHQIKELKLEKNVEFLGHIEGHKKEELLRNNYALVLPSKSENFGNVVVEALSNSMLVIASKGTPWESLNKNNIGWWVAGSPDDLAKAIDLLYGLSDEEYLEKCKNSLKYVREEFDIDTSPHNKWIEIYTNLIF